MVEKRKGLKSFFAVLLSVLLIWLTVFVAFTAIKADAASATTTDGVNVRSGPGTGYSILTALITGTTVTVLDTSNSAWYKIQTSDGTVGYMSTDYLRVSGSVSSSAVGTGTTTAYVNLRTGPSTGYSIITTLAYGASVTVLSQNNGGWYQVRTASGNVGYVSADYLSVSLNSSSSSSSSSNNSSSSSNGSSLEMKLGKGTAKDYVNVRTGDSTIYPIITTLSPGTSVEVIGVYGSWYQIKTASGTQGYLDGSYIQMDITSNSNGQVSGNSGVAIDYVNVRTGDSTIYPVITVLSPGVGVEILAVYGSWYHIKTASGTEGYLDGSYIQRSGSNSGSSSQTPSNMGVTTNYVNVRTGDSTIYPVITVLSPGVSVEVLAIYGSWYHIKTASGTKGYLDGSYVKMNNAGSEDVSPEAPEEPEPSEPEPIEPVTVDILSAPELISVGGSADVIVEVKNNGEVDPVVVSSDKNVLTVSLSSEEDGVYTYEVTGISIGSAEITVLAGEAEETVSVDVFQYARVTDFLNLRSGPGTDYDVIDVLSLDDLLKVFDDSLDGWAKIETLGGLEGYVSVDYIEFGSSDSGSISLSHANVSIPVGKTMYTTATAADYSGILIWETKDSSVATVSNGYIYAVSEGSTIVTVRDVSGKNVASCSVTVTAADPIKFVYTTPNTAGINENMELVAITDTTRTAVKFVVTTVSGDQEYIVESFTEESNSGSDVLAATHTRVWTQSVSFPTAGTYSVKVYSMKNGVWSENGKETTAFIVTTQDKTTTAYGSRRASDEVLQIIAKFEGYCASVYADAIAYGIPTIGHGYVISKGEQFYNNLTKREAWALLCDITNNRSYTTQVNRFISLNNLKVSQGQFDSMVSFSYNIGAGYWNGSDEAFDLRRIILNAVDITALDFTNGLGGKMSFTVNAYADTTGTTAPVATLNKGARVTVVEAIHSDEDMSTWYKVKVADSEYWVKGAFVELDNNDEMIHDLRYVDSVSFGSEILAWHMAGGSCYPGLLYRRLAEGKLFSFSDYEEANPADEYYTRNTYHYIYPSCMKGYEE